MRSIGEHFSLRHHSTVTDLPHQLLYIKCVVCLELSCVCVCMIVCILYAQCRDYSYYIPSAQCIGTSLLLLSLCAPGTSVFMYTQCIGTSACVCVQQYKQYLFMITGHAQWEIIACMYVYMYVVYLCHSPNLSHYGSWDQCTHWNGHCVPVYWCR